MLEHISIVDAMRGHDPEAAATAMAAHIDKRGPICRGGHVLTAMGPASHAMLAALGRRQTVQFD